MKDVGQVEPRPELLRNGGLARARGAAQDDDERPASLEEARHGAVPRQDARAGAPVFLQHGVQDALKLLLIDVEEPSVDQLLLDRERYPYGLAVRSAKGV